MEGGGNKFAKFTVPALKAFLKVGIYSKFVRQQPVARAKGWQKTYFFHELAIFWLAEKRCKDTFFPFSITFPCNFRKRNNNGIFTASQFYVQFPLLYTVWSNASSEIGPEVTLQTLATFCAKDYKGHSLEQTSFTESPIALVCILVSIMISSPANFRGQLSMLLCHVCRIILQKMASPIDLKNGGTAPEKSQQT